MTYRPAQTSPHSAQPLLSFLLKRSILLCGFLSVGLCLEYPTVGFAQVAREQVELAKAATVLVERPSGDGFGTAFCISKNGFFITNEHVVRGETEQIPLILFPGTKSETTVHADVVRIDPKKDLALLRSDQVPDNLPALELGIDADLFETQSITVFGYPFGTSLALNNKKYPNVSINVGRITSLRRRADSLESIQMDAVVNQGNSGGPVVNDNGQVVGVVVEKIVGTDVNFAIPVSNVKSFLNKPGLAFTKPTIRFPFRHVPIDFNFRVVSFGPASEKYRFELTLRNNLGEVSETSAGEPNDQGIYSLRASPVQRPKTRLRLPVKVNFESGLVSGEMNEQRIRFGDSIQYLTDMKSIERTPAQKWRLTRYDGKSVTLGDLEFSNPTIFLGGSEIKLEIDSFNKIEIGKPKKLADTLTYEAKLIGTAGIIARNKGEIQFIGVPGSTNDAEDASETEEGISGSDPDYELPTGEATFKENQVVYELETPYDDYVMGRGDQYMIFKMGKQQRIIVFDLLAGNIIHEIQNIDSDALMCAGSKNLFVVLPSQMLIHRYSLDSFKIEKTIRLTTRNAPKQAVIGVNAEGPILLFDGEEAYFVDTTQLKPFRIDGKQLFAGGERFGRQMDASANGKVFGSIMTGLGPVSYDLLFLEEDVFVQGQFGSTSNAIRWAAPSADGRLFFLPRGQIYNMVLQDVSPQWLKDSRLFPTVDPRYFISVRFKTRAGNERFTSLDVCTASDLRIVHSNLDLNELSPQNGGRSADANKIVRDLEYGQTKVHYVPWAKLIAYTGYDKKRIYVRKYDFEARLQETGEDYLFVESLPPLLAFKNEKLTYEIQCKTNSDSLTFKLVEGPAEMRVTNDGVLTWTPPRGAVEGLQSVVIGITGNKGDQIFHTFDCLVAAKVLSRGSRRAGPR
ncbi:Putative serine protease HhoB precursor [Roseimaritima multifibrata]|uniref:Serine protease HhoB n=1 Tax=Roseimaritima multifibrata TaxID=1930274 RepID=A0A517MDM9_9BACT|nr:serine protease [Roseimaritima multifibrata]QDS92988.1 Putative serine protease HhoB precursor [Roseimaritima multifibrata]